MSEARRLHPLSPFFDLFGLARQLVAPGVLALTRGGLRLVVLAVVVVLAFRALSWWRTTYVLDGATLRLESGLLARNQQVVPIDRVQQVNSVRALRHRVLGVVTLRVETAGGGGLDLEVVSDDEAARLRAALSRPSTIRWASEGTPGPGGGQPAWVPAEWSVVRLGFKELAVAGLTGAQLFVVFAVLGSVLQFLVELPGQPFERTDVPATPLPGAVLAVLGAVAGLALWLGSAVAASVLRDGGYELSLIGEELHLRRGLLDRKETVLPLARVQVVRLTASPLRRLFGLVSLRLQSAGRAGGGDDSRVVIPILRAAEVDRVLDLVVPGASPLPPLLQPPRAALRRAVTRRVVPAGVVTLALTVAAFPWGAIALGLVPVAAGLGLAAYRGLGHARHGDFLVARTGAIVRSTVVVPVARAQSGRLRASALQRRAGVATAYLDVAGAGRTPRVVDEASSVARTLVEAVRSIR